MYLSIDQSVYLSTWRRVLTTVRHCTPTGGAAEDPPCAAPPALDSVARLVNAFPLAPVATFLYRVLPPHQVRPYISIYIYISIYLYIYIYKYVHIYQILRIIPDGEGVHARARRGVSTKTPAATPSVYTHTHTPIYIYICIYIYVYI